MRRLDCGDVVRLLAKLAAISVIPYATLGPGGSTRVFVTDYQLLNGCIRPQ